MAEVLRQWPPDTLVEAAAHLFLEVGDGGGDLIGRYAREALIQRPAFGTDVPLQQTKMVGVENEHSICDASCPSFGAAIGGRK
jgi:hypothetical protein